MMKISEKALKTAEEAQQGSIPTRKRSLTGYPVNQNALRHAGNKN